MIKEGEKAPDFSLENQDGESVKLSDYSGKWLIVYFYPKDNTPGCTLEAIDFTRLIKDFDDLNAAVIGVSKDSCGSHKKFIEGRELGVDLISDPDHVMQEAYGVWREKSFLGKKFMGTVRSSYLIDPEGVVRKVWDDVSAKGHAEEVLGTLKSLCFLQT